MSSQPTAPASDPGFGIYVHWPFCAQKCPYCDFNSHVRRKGWDEERFLAAYKRELDHTAALIGARRVESIFFGGGTPSLMKPATTAAILDHITKLWNIAPSAEITLEANPGSVEAARFRGYRDAGINRVSMGLQSLRDDDLKRLGRIHTVTESLAALAIARATFERFSFDLIYARPGQHPDAWRAELRQALDLAGGHISLYQLTIEPDTPYAALQSAGKLVVPDPDAALALYEITQDMTGAEGLNAYEISNHARAGQESRHNLLYWRYGEYAGIGPGAHGRILVEGNRLATVAEKGPETWCALVENTGFGAIETTPLTRAEQADEMLLMGLRLREGLDLQRLQSLSGVRPAQSVIDGLIQLGLLEQDRPAGANGLPGLAGNWRANELEPIAMCSSPGLAPDNAPQRPAAWIRATQRGRFVLNTVVAELANSFQPVRRMDTAHSHH